MFRTRSVAVQLVAAVAVGCTGGRLSAQPCQPAWAALGGGADSHVFSLAVFDEDGPGPRPALLYVGGQFSSAGGVPASFIARWDGQFWSAVGGGADNPVWAMQVHDEDGSGPGLPALFVGGTFTMIGGIPTAGIARWDGQNWSDVGGGMGGPIPAVFGLGVFDEDGPGPGLPALFAGGAFTQAGSTAASRLARWSGGVWSDVGGGVDGFDPFISALRVHDEDGAGPGQPTLFVAGEFSAAGGFPANNIARWNGSTWSAPGSGTNGFIDELEVFDEDGDGPGLPALFACGAFSRAGGVLVNGIARWNGTAWSSVGGGLGRPAFTLAVFDEDGTGPLRPALFAGGLFTTAGGQPASHIARWDGAAWSEPGGGTSHTVRALLSAGEVGPPLPRPALYVGGEFASAGGIPASRVAAWVGCRPACPGDVNGDGRVDQQDLGILLANWLQSVPPHTRGDLNGDGRVDQQDLGILLGNWMRICT